MKTYKIIFVNIYLEYATTTIEATTIQEAKDIFNKNSPQCSFCSIRQKY